MGCGTYYINYMDKYPEQISEQAFSVVVSKPTYYKNTIIAKAESENNIGYEIIAKGVSGTDDYNILSAAIEYLSELGGGSLYIRAGEYDLKGNKLDVSDNICVVGENKKATKVIGDIVCSNNCTVKSINIGSVELNGDRCSIYDCVFNSDAETFVTSNYSGTMVFGNHFEGNDGCVCFTGSGSVISNIFKPKDSTYSISVNIDGGVFSNNYIDGSVTTGSTVMIDGNKILRGLKVGSNCTVTNNYIDVTSTPIDISNTTGVVVVGNVLHSSSTTYVYGFTHTGATHAKLDNNSTVGSVISSYSRISITLSVIGDGTTTSFSSPHFLYATPSVYIVSPSDGNTPYPDTIYTTDTDLTIGFTTAPAAGTVYVYHAYLEVY